MYALKKLWLRLTLGRGPRLPPHLAHHVRVKMDLVLLGSVGRETGLCVCIKAGLYWTDRDTVSAWLLHQFQLWPHNSGSTSFPVPHRMLSPEEAYYQYDMWVGGYGAMRLNLAKHLLAAAERDMGIKP